MAAVVLLPAACIGPSKESRKTIAELTASGEHAAVAERVRAVEDEYGASNAVLYELDLGMALHVAGRYGESSKHFARSEDRMEAFYTRKVSRAAGAILANENVEEYRGDHSDRALVHIFHALNYVQSGELDEALVEVRRLEAFLDERARNMEHGSVSYKDDAFAHYLAALLYEDADRPDDARISYEAAKKAYHDYAEHYNIPAPSFPFPGNLGSDGELVFLHYNGPAPHKKSVSTAGGGNSEEPSSGKDKTSTQTTPSTARNSFVKIAVSAVDAGKAGLIAAGKVTDRVAGAVLNIAYPEYVQNGFSIKQSQVELDQKIWKTELVEDIFAIVKQDLNERLAVLKSRSAMRATVKFLGTVTGVDATGSEFADVRYWQTLPSQIRIARIRLPAGEHQVTLRYLDEAGTLVSSRPAKVLIRSNRRSWLIDRTAD
jgi:hypothetical protein